MLIDEKISRWLSRRNARVSRNEVKIAPWIAPSRACSWFWKQKIWLAICEFLFRDFPVNQFNFKFLHSISTFCSNFVFLHSKNFKFLHCLGLIDMLSANQHGEIFSCILLVLLFFSLPVILSTILCKGIKQEVETINSRERARYSRTNQMPFVTLNSFKIERK